MGWGWLPWARYRSKWESLSTNIKLKACTVTSPQTNPKTHSTLNLATPRGCDHGDISEVIRPQNDKTRSLYPRPETIHLEGNVYPRLWKYYKTVKDAEHIESAHRRISVTKPKKMRIPWGWTEGDAEPMDIGNILLKKLTPAAREKCMKVGRCLCCREKWNLARNCPRALGN